MRADMPSNLKTTLRGGDQVIATWEGHAGLYGYFEREQSRDGWEDRPLYADFPPKDAMNGKEIELDASALRYLDNDVRHGMLPIIGPSFEGAYIDPEDSVDKDRAAIAKALEAIKSGQKVFVRSEWEELEAS
jgi:hypothetical protein